MTYSPYPKPLLGLLAGTLGGAVGLLAMRCYWEGVSQFNRQGNEDRPPSRRTPSHSGWGHELDDISFVGRQHRKGETSTAATGRIAFHAMTGRDPSEPTHNRLDHAAHWAFGLTMGGLYGILRRRAGFPDLHGGLMFSTGVWLIGDEISVPLLGLQGGPTAASPAQHLNRLAVHLAYGAGLAVATQGVLHAVDRPRPSRSSPSKGHRGRSSP